MRYLPKTRTDLYNEVCHNLALPVLCLIHFDTLFFGGDSLIYPIFLQTLLRTYTMLKYSNNLSMSTT